MDIIPEILLIVLPIILGVSLSLKKPSITKLTIIWLIVAIVVICAVCSILNKKKHDQKAFSHIESLDEKLSEMIIVVDDFLEKIIEDKLATYLDDLDSNESFRETLRSGRDHEQQSKFKDAIIEYNKCLSQFDVTLKNRIALQIIIGNCHFYLRKLEDAERCYNNALNETNSLEDEKEINHIKSVAHSNLGFVYQQLGKFNKAIDSHQQALKYYDSIGDIPWSTRQLNNLSTIYQAVGNPQEALSLSKKAIENVELFYANEIKIDDSK